jgi:type III secretion protein Q
MKSLALRHVDEQTHIRTHAVRRWLSAGQRAGVSQLQAQGGYLRFSARGKRCDWQGLIQASDWLHHSLPQLASLLTAECPPKSILSLFHAVPRPLALLLDELHYESLADIELIDAPMSPAQALPWIDTASGRLWVTVLPPENAPDGSLESRAWLSDLSLRLELILGVSGISQSSHERLARGDLLRINQRTHRCVLSGLGIGVFTFTEGGLHMQFTVDDTSNPPTAETGVDAAIEQLPVRLEFVLATHDIELGTLQNIIAGQLIPLAAGTEMHIEVRCHGKRVARGELVQLEGQLAVELLEVYRTVTDE